jgi:galactonate dehydratase
LGHHPKKPRGQKIVPSRIIAVPFANFVDREPNKVIHESMNHTSLTRRSFLKTAALAAASTAIGLRPTYASLPKAKITKVNIYRPPNLNVHFNQSNMVVTIETDQAGLIGVGEGGARDTIEQCAQRLIGMNPFDIERCWQDMYRAWFYPPGREKIHALGALDMALF